MSIVYGLVTFYGSRKEKKKTTSLHKTLSKDKQDRFLHYKTDVVV